MCVSIFVYILCVYLLVCMSVRECARACLNTSLVLFISWLHTLNCAIHVNELPFHSFQLVSLNAARTVRTSHLSAVTPDTCPRT